jgi:hypothetical protein
LWPPRFDDDLDCGVRAANIAVTKVMFRIPVPDASLDLAEP